MTYWYTADQHFFGHANIISHCDRPFKDRAEMDGILMHRWNERVKPQDTVIIAGDFAMPPRGVDVWDYVNRLNGHKVFIRGSHDQHLNPKLRTLTVNHGGFDWWVQHEPAWKYKYNLCGHIHNHWRVKWQEDSVCINIGVDQWEFCPISMEDILRAIKEEPRHE